MTQSHINGTLNLTSGTSRRKPGRFCRSRTTCISLLFWLASVVGSSAQTFTKLFSFNVSDGANPLYSALVQGVDGNMYGTTENGGANDAGTVYKITFGGRLTTLYNFCSQPSCTDGYGPSGGLVLDTNGDFFGVTVGGGINSGNLDSGTVFKITPDGNLTTLHKFCTQSSCSDGATPASTLVRGADGDFYGTTTFGGTAGQGTIFKITPAGVFTLLSSLECTESGCLGGSTPYGPLLQAMDGNFYGTSYAGGPYFWCLGGGVLFAMTPAGGLTTVHDFCMPNGFTPMAGVIEATNGNFYGTTLAGGEVNEQGFGTVFEETTGGKVYSLYTFCLEAGCPDGNYPQGLIQATDGNLYGMTVQSGYNDGTVFEITTTGQLTTLHSFSGADGLDPDGALLQATNGVFYGTTRTGGDIRCSYGQEVGCGSIFGLSTGLGPFVKTVPGLGKPGDKVIILGNNLQGTISVTFNGIVVGSFSVNSSGSAITATVPTGATTGTVVVTTPTGTLNSNVAFRVP